MECLEIMQEFPLLSSWKDHKYWTGFLTSQSVLVRLAVQVPNFPSSQGIVLEGDEDALKIFEPYQQKIQSMMDSKEPVIIVLRQLQLIIVEHVKTNEDSSSTSNNLGNGSEFYSTVFGELEQIGPQNVESASRDFSDLSIKHYDQKNRKHILRLHIPPQYPKAPVKVFTEFPCPQDSSTWPHKLQDVHYRFKAEIEKYTEFWDTMDELDNQTRVIDPIQPNRSDVHRRVLINNNNVLVHLVFNPSCSRSFPEIKFSGPEKAVEELDILLDRDCKKWTESKPILENLEDILQCAFVEKQDPNAYVEEEAPESTCVICCVFEFEGNVPETNCECGSVYHDKCLGDLLVNDCTVKAMRFSVECPVCGLELKVSKQQDTW